MTKVIAELVNLEKICSQKLVFKGKAISNFMENLLFVYCRRKLSGQGHVVPEKYEIARYTLTTQYSFIGILPSARFWKVLLDSSRFFVILQDFV